MTKKPIPTTTDYAKQNELAARLILSRPDLNPDGSLAARWARKIIEAEKGGSKHGSL